MSGTVSARRRARRPARTVRAGRYRARGRDGDHRGQLVGGAAGSRTGRSRRSAPNSRMMIQAYEYNAQAKTGNIVLNLLSRRHAGDHGPHRAHYADKVTYRAGNYTIGIRGTDVNDRHSTAATSVVAVTEGLISFTFGRRRPSPCRRAQGVQRDDGRHVPAGRDCADRPAAAGPRRRAQAACGFDPGACSTLHAAVARRRRRTVPATVTDARSTRDSPASAGANAGSRRRPSAPGGGGTATKRWIGTRLMRAPACSGPGTGSDLWRQADVSTGRTLLSFAQVTGVAADSARPAERHMEP